MNSIMLDDFCNTLKAGRTPPEKLLPGEVARRFVGHFGFSPFSPHGRDGPGAEGSGYRDCAGR